METEASKTQPALKRFLVMEDCLGPRGMMMALELQFEGIARVHQALTGSRGTMDILAQRTAFAKAWLDVLGGSEKVRVSRAQEGSKASLDRA